MLFAYHADDEIRDIALAFGMPAAVLVVGFCIVLMRRWPQGSGGNPSARRALVAALVTAPFVLVAGGLLGALLLPAVIPLALLGYSIVAIRRVPAGGGKQEAIAAFGVSGLLSAYIVARAVACVAVGGCFH